MAHHSTQPGVDTPEDTRPPDVETMRVSVRHALAEAPQPDELDTLRTTLRGHIQLLAPEVEKLAGKQPNDSPSRACALACVGEARRKLRMGDGSPILNVRVSVVEKLARSVNALCEHFEALGGRTS